MSDKSNKAEIEKSDKSKLKTEMQKKSPLPFKEMMELEKRAGDS
ncbi:thymosin beta-11-like [Nycticebus coucang]|nr:thymosin beta-11-like [Nycticebus coucang]